MKMHIANKCLDFAAVCMQWSRGAGGCVQCDGKCQKIADTRVITARPAVTYTVATLMWPLYIVHRLQPIYHGFWETVMG